MYLTKSNKNKFHKSKLLYYSTRFIENHKEDKFLFWLTDKKLHIENVVKKYFENYDVSINVISDIRIKKTTSKIYHYVNFYVKVNFVHPIDEKMFFVMKVLKE